MYLIVLDDKGNRITSLVLGIHGDTKDDLISYAKKEFKTSKYVWGGQDVQDKYLNAERKASEPTPAEIEKQAEINALVESTQKLKADIQAIKDEWIYAKISGNDELAQELQDEYLELVGE